jgi:hypothetical protein
MDALTREVAAERKNAERCDIINLDPDTVAVPPEA